MCVCVCVRLHVTEDMKAIYRRSLEPRQEITGVGGGGGRNDSKLLKTSVQVYRRGWYLALI